LSEGLYKCKSLTVATLVHRELEKTLPPTMTCDIESTQLGLFGDGFINYIPKDERHRRKTFVTSSEDNSCLYRSISQMMYGHDRTYHALRVCSTTWGAAH
ncbi:unnamed protein product, partial [Owenia fusiformis]